MTNPNIDVLIKLSSEGAGAADGLVQECAANGCIITLHLDGDKLTYTVESGSPEKVAAVAEALGINLDGNRILLT